MPTKTFHAMGSRITVVLDGEADALEPVPHWFEEWESALSRFRPDSELNRLSSTPGGIANASPALCAVVEESLRAAEATDGLVTPLAREAVEAAGYDRTFEEIESIRPGDGTSGAPVPDWRAIRCEPARGLIQLPKGSRLDPGGIAKGWAADQTTARLAGRGPVLADAGGDIAVSAPRAGGTPWPIGVGNPFGGDDPLLTIALAGGGVATSGRDYRKWVRGGRMCHHIIDPRTGEPAHTDVLTATVVAASAAEAEAGAKAAFILGADAGLAWLDRRPELAGMLVLDDRRILYSRRFMDFIWN